MTHDPVDPSMPLRREDASDSESVDVAWFRRTVQPILSTRPTIDRWPELRDELVSGEPGPTRVAPPRHPAPPPRRAPQLIIAAAVVSIIVTAIGIGSRSSHESELRTQSPGSATVTASVPRTSREATSPSSTTVTSAPVTISDAPGPSQSVAEADRDGVLPALAQVPASQRVSVEGSVELPEGTWVLSRARDVRGPEGDVVLGDPDGAYAHDFVNTVEYGEVLLLDLDGEIARAYPMPGWPPHWVHATPDAIYGGRVGDGGLPDSTIFRIDRRTLTLQGIVIPASGPDGGDARHMPGWREAKPEVAAAFGRFDLVDHRPGRGGTLATSTIDQIRIHLPAIEALFR